MSKNRKASFQDVGEELDRRLGGLLGEVGATLGEVLNRLDQIGDAEILRERNFDTGNGAVRAGIRVRMGGFDTGMNAPSSPDDGEFGAASEARKDQDGTPDGPSQDARAAPREDPVRAIEATILTVDGTWTLIADLPGVDRTGITLGDTGRGGELVLTAEGRQRKYAGRFDLPDGVNADDLSVALVNGILELRAVVPTS